MITINGFSERTAMGRALPGLAQAGGDVWSEVVERVEALLFVATEPATLGALAVALTLTEGQVEQALDALETKLRAGGAVQLVRLAGGYQLCTKPEHAELVAAFLRPQRNRLGKGMLETLAIVAYRQPVTVAEIEQIRGVQSDFSVRSLVERRLVREVGRKLVAGRPILYGTTQQFLHQFNLDDLSQLPELQLEAATGVEI